MWDFTVESLYLIITRLKHAAILEVFFVALICAKSILGLRPVPTSHPLSFEMLIASEMLTTKIPNVADHLYAR